MPSKTQFEILWEEACREYAASTGVDPNDSSQKDKPASPDELFALLDKHHHDFEKYRKKKETLRRVLSLALKPVQLLGGIASGAVTTVFAPSAYIFAAVRHLVDSANNVSAAYDAIIELFDKLKPFTTRLELHARSGDVPALYQALVVKIFGKILVVCGQSTKLIREGRIKRFLKAFLLLDSPEIKTTLGEIDRLTGEEQQLVLAIISSSVVRIDTKIDSLGVKVDGLSHQVDMKFEEMKESLLSKMRSSTAPKEMQETTNYLSNVLQPEVSVEKDLDERFKKVASSGTAKWILDEPLFVAWRENRTPVVRISGGPGTGKSCLSSYIIKSMTEWCQERCRGSVAYFFCRSDIPSTQSFTNILKTLAFQIAGTDPEYASQIEGACKTPQYLQSVWGVWKKLFDIEYQSREDAETIYIIIDGVDEAEPQSTTEFLEQLDAFLKANGDASNLQFLLVGRPEVKERLDIMDAPVPSIEISAQKNRADIKKYIEYRVASRQARLNLRKKPRGFIAEITTRLIAQCDGMFLWVELMMDEIIHRRGTGDLHNLPKGLPDTYRRILERYAATLEPEELTTLNELIQWVTCAERPLTLDELEGIVKFNCEDCDFSLLENDLRSRYSSLFVVTRTDGLTDAEVWESKRLDALPNSSDETVGGEIDSDDDFELDTIESNPKTTTVRLRHASLKDFFRSDKNQPPKAGMRLEQSNIKLTLSCLAIIRNKEGEEEAEAEEMEEGMADPSGIMSYACRFWCHHLGAINFAALSIGDQTKLLEGVFTVLAVPSVTTRWLTHTLGLSELNHSIGWLEAELNPIGWLGAYTQEPNPFTKYLFGTDNTDSFRKVSLLTDGVDNCSPEIAKWIQTFMKGSPYSFLHALANVSAQLWLQSGTDSDKSWCYEFLEACIQMMDPESPTTPGRGISTTTWERIIKAAKWAEFERDKTWFYNIGSLLGLWATKDDSDEDSLNLGIVDGSIEALQKALHMATAEGDTDLVFKAALNCANALAFKSIDGPYEQSRFADTEAYLRQAVEALGRVKKPRARYRKQLKRLASLQFQIDNFGFRTTSEFVTMKEAFEFDPGNLEVTNFYLAGVAICNDDDEYMAILQCLDSLPAPTEGGGNKPHSAFSEFLWMQVIVREESKSSFDFWGGLELVTNRTQQTAFISRGFEEAILAAKESRGTEAGLVSALRVGLGTIRSCDNEDQAIHLWEIALSDPALKYEGNAYNEWRNVGMTKLGKAYLLRALDSMPDGKHVAKLISFSQRWKPVEESAVQGKRDALIQLVVRFWLPAIVFREKGEVERMRAYVKECIAVSATLLLDEDGTNDDAAYELLLKSLVIAEDDENAKITSNFAHLLPAEDENEDKDDEGDGEDGGGDETASGEVRSAPGGGAEGGAASVADSLTGNDQITCGGLCEGMCGQYNGFYSCRMCYDVNLCPPCYGILQSGENFPPNICRKNHRFLHIKAPQGMWLDSGKQRAQWGGEEYVLSEWLDRLKKDWNIM